MNDEDLELLSAYLDGVLPEAERKTLEARIAASAELRRELDEMRAVAQSVRDLPKEPLPPGFLVRFQARRARGDAPRADWVFLPPALRPVALALSCAVVALVIWDKVAAPPEEEAIHPPGAAAVADSKNAPVSQLDLAGRLQAGAAAPAPAASDAAALQGIQGAASEPAREGESLPYEAQKEAADAGARKAAADLAAGGLRSEKRGRLARAAGAPIGADGAAAGGASVGAVAAERGAPAMTEEERSAKNEQMFGFLEGEKKKMGIAKMIPKDDSDAASFAPAAATAAPKIAAAAPSLLKPSARSAPTALAAAPAAAAKPAAGPAAGTLSPDAGLVFTDARSLSTSWVLLGLPGLPPSVDFASGRLVVIKPSNTKILSVAVQPNSVDVVYRSLEPEETEASDPAQDRVAPIPLEPKTVLIFDASPR